MTRLQYLRAFRERTGESMVTGAEWLRLSVELELAVRFAARGYTPGEGVALMQAVVIYGSVEHLDELEFVTGPLV